MMAEALSWVLSEQTLFLHGVLERDTLLPLWQQQETVLANKTTIDVSQLQRVDSAGLALLLHLCNPQSTHKGSLKIAGRTKQLQELISLYNLQALLPVQSTE
jgi:phospholipid transport system transporter-binding protein